MTTQKKKVAVLGGGIAALSAVYELTNRAGWDQQYEVTVYQMGWRIGGKGASGRNPEKSQRIEEHGLHVWFGCYENAFRIMRECYQQLNRPPDAPLAGLEQAFKLQEGVYYAENLAGKWEDWAVRFPNNQLQPGKGGKIPTPSDFIYILMQLVIDGIELLNIVGKNLHQVTPPHLNAKRTVLQSLADFPNPNFFRRLSLTGTLWALKKFMRDSGAYTNLSGFQEDTSTEILSLLSSTDEAALIEVGFSRTMHLAEAIITGHSIPTPNRSKLNRRIRVLEMFANKFYEAVGEQIEQNATVRHFCIFIDWAMTCVRGMVVDDILTQGFDVIDDIEFRDWLQKHGATIYGSHSALVQSLYDMIFAYEDGDIKKPNLAASVGLRGMLRIVFGYRGGLFYKMQSGMGDVVFTPLYEILTQRGVKFEFFHTVKNLKLSADQSFIDQIEIGRQITLKNGTYNPLVNVKGLDCWPSYPLYDQIVEGEALQTQQINLESFWADWQDVETLTLQAGQDFDHILLGIPVAAFPFICSELIAADDRWRLMVEKVKTVQTAALQLWFKPTLKEMGRDLPHDPMLAGYVEPLSSWGDFSQLIPSEDWQPGEVGNIAYFCGALEETQHEQPIPKQDLTYPAQKHQQVKEISLDLLQNHAYHLWPQTTLPSNSNELDWDKLVGDEQYQGSERIETQYYRANIDPSERYILSVTGSSRYRLRAEESGFKNLALAGTWINNGFNACCIEAAVISGIQASRAICGYPEYILGESDF